VIRSRTNAITVKGGTGSRSVNVIHNINLLDGQITADTVRAVSRRHITDRGMRAAAGDRSSSACGSTARSTARGLPAA